MNNLKFTTAYWFPIEQKLNIYKQLSISFNEFELNLYTNEIDKIGIIFQCFPKDIKSRTVKEFKSLKRKTKVLELYLVLDYDRIMQGTDHENLEYLKAVFLQGCETFLKPLKDFDYNRFINEVKTLLAITP